MTPKFRLTATTFIALLVLIFAVSCRDNQSSPSANAGGSKREIGDKKVAVNSSKAAWPPLAKDGKEVVLDKNLIARNYYVVFDGSGSMDDKACGSNDKKIMVARRALGEWGKTISSDANLGLLTFDNRGIAERVTLGVGGKNRNNFTNEINVAGPSGGTPLYSAIVIAYEKLENQARKQLGYGEYNLVVVTDGEANVGENPKQIVNYVSENSPVVIHTIGFCIGSNHSLNQRGRTNYKEANNPESLKDGLKEVLAESSTFDPNVFSK